MSAPSARPKVRPEPSDLFVGRERELAELRAALDRAVAGSGSVHTISGEPGIGKTRLAEELGEYASAAGARVLKGRSHEARAALPYRPWLQAIRPLLDGSTDRQLAADWGASADVALLVLPELGTRLPHVEPYRTHSDSDGGRLRIADALCPYLLRASRRHPLLLVLDDLQWADRDSLELLVYLASELPTSRILVLGIHRHTGLDARHPLLRALGDLVKERSYREHRLEGLSEAEVESCLRSASGDGCTPERAREVHRLTAGNPLYVSQLAREPAWPSTPLPQGIRAAVAGRLASLNPHTREVLEAACLFAGEFRVDLLATALEQPVTTVLAAVDVAIRAALVRQVAGQPGHHEFVHVLFRDALAAELPLDRKVRLHARIGETLEGYYAQDAQAHAPELVLHFAAARPVVGGEKPARYALAAARLAMETQSWEETLEQVATGLAALEGCPMDDLQAELLSVRAIAANVAGLLTDDVRQGAELAFEQFERTGNSRCAVELIRRTGYFLAWRHGPAFRERALRLARPGTSDAAWVLTVTAMGLSRLGKHRGEALAAHEEALKLAACTDDATLRVFVLLSRAGIDLAHARFPARIELLRAAVELAVELGDRRMECRMRCNLASVLAFLAGTAEARVHVRKALEIAGTLGERMPLLDAWNEAAQLAFWEGDLAGAAHYLDLYWARAPLGVSFVSGWDPLERRMAVELESGRIEDARRTLEQAFGRMKGRKPGWNSATYDACDMIAEYSYVTGDTSHLGDLRRWADFIRAAPEPTPIMRLAVWLHLSRVAWLTGDLELAGEQLDQYDSLPGGKEAAIWIWSGICGGLLARALGRLDEAVETLRTTCDEQRWCVWRYCRTAHELAETLRLRRGPGDLREAEALWKEALELATRHGMKATAGLIQAGLDRMGDPGGVQHPDGLTDREIEVLRLVAAGKTNKEIGWELFVSERTVERHLTGIFAKTRVTNRTEAAAYALRRGLAAADAPGPASP